MNYKDGMSQAEIDAMTEVTNPTRRKTRRAGVRP